MNGLVADPILAPVLGFGAAITLAAAIAVCALLVALIGFWRGLGGAVWRGLSVALIAAALAGPSLQRGTAQALSNIVVLITDRSASQSLPGRPDQIEAAQTSIEASVAELPNTELRRIDIGDDPDGTLLGAAVTRAIAAEPAQRLAGTIVISDGLAHDPAAIPDNAPAPVHVLQTGTPGDWDRRIVLEQAPRYALIDQQVMIRLHIADDGDPPIDVPATSTLDVSLDGETVSSTAVSVGTTISVPVTLDRAGPNVVSLSIASDPRELTPLNNQTALTVNAVRDRLRVLLISGEPNPGERTWRNLLKSDANIDLIHFTILRPPEKFDGVPLDELALVAFPTQELFSDRIKDFDLIIFDRYRMRGILLPEYYENIRSYVEDGGAILVSAGPEFASVDSIARSPLGPILPASPTGLMREAPVMPHLTEAGRRHPVTASLPGAPAIGTDSQSDRADGQDREAPDWGRWLRMIETVPAADAVVAMVSDDDTPLLTLRQAGEGRAALIASDMIWLWGRGFEGGGPQLDLMRRVAHWAMKEPQLEPESIDLRAVGATQIEITRRSLNDSVGPARISAQDIDVRDIALAPSGPGRFVTRFDAPAPGLYTVRQEDLVRSIAIGPASPREFDRTVADPVHLEPLVNQTGGSVSRLSDGIPDLRQIGPGRPAAGAGITRPWIGVQDRGAQTVTGLARRPLLPAWAWLVLIVGTMLAGWMREGRAVPAGSPLSPAKGRVRS